MKFGSQRLQSHFRLLSCLLPGVCHIGGTLTVLRPKWGRLVRLSILLDPGRLYARCFQVHPLCAVAFLVFALAWDIHGQATEGKIIGTVTDSSGASSNARITGTSVERGTGQTTVTNGDGIYTVPAVEPGSYIVSVVAPGLRKR